MSEQDEKEQDPKRWFADGFGGRWEVPGDLAAKLRRLNPTLAEARAAVLSYIEGAFQNLDEELDKGREEELESFIGVSEAEIEDARAELRELTAGRGEKTGNSEASGA